MIPFPHRRGAVRPEIVTYVTVGIAAILAAVFLYQILAKPPAPTTSNGSAPAPTTGGSGGNETASAPKPPAGLFGGDVEVPVLMYHDIVERIGVYFDVTKRDFKRQLEQLDAAGVQPISLDALYEHLKTGRSLPEKPVVLTFDDTYLGQFQNAYPLLKARRWPAVFFVHTDVIGRKTGRDHMTWAQLARLDKEGLVRIEGHTASHPDDLRKCSDSQLQREIVESKKILEEKLGRRIRFFAYPVGRGDSRVAKVVRDAGYELAFTMGPGWAASPEDAYFVPRLSPARVREICSRYNAREEQSLDLDEEPLKINARVLDLRPQPLECGFIEDGQVRLRYIRGGSLSTLRLLGRRDVPQMVDMAAATAGLNGTFFSDARINSAGSGIVGPVLSQFGPGFAPGLPGDRERIAGRPFVVISPTKMAFLPFRPHLALDDEGVRRLVPDATDAFIAGAWLIHQGTPLTHHQIEGFRLSNAFDFRPRAFMGIDSEGRPFLGASSTGNQSDRVAESLVQLGLRECILLDSGFSTSLVLGGTVLVSGIRRKDMPARPVPHVLVLHPVDSKTGEAQLARSLYDKNFIGPVEPRSLERLQAMLQQELPSSVAADRPSRPRRKRRRR